MKTPKVVSTSIQNHEIRSVNVTNNKDKTSRLNRGCPTSLLFLEELDKIIISPIMAIRSMETNINTFESIF